MVSSSFFNNGLEFLFKYGNQINIKLINYSFTTSDYDDVTTKTVTGSFFTSGVEFPIRSKFGSEEALLMEQGKLSTQDKIVFIGSATVNTSGLIIGIGSPNPTAYYTIIPDGVRAYNINGNILYQKLYLRQTIPGSLF